MTLAYGRYTRGERPLTEMTLDEVERMQGRMRASGAPSTAVGRYQIKKSTLRELRGRLRLRGDELMDKDMQDRLGRELLRKRGIDRYLSGRVSAARFQDNLANEWASIPVSSTGRSRYGQRVGTTPAQIRSAIAGLGHDE